MRIAIGDESLPRGVPPDAKITHVIEGGTPEATVVEQKSEWLDQVHFNSETRGKTQQCTRILRYVRLKQRQAQKTSKPD